MHAPFTLFAFDWEVFVAAVVVVIALLWIHFAFTSKFTDQRPMHLLADLLARTPFTR
jgi:hypothetical protein